MSYRCTCVQRPELVQTGYCAPAADLMCPVCYVTYWLYKGSLEKERPAVWPSYAAIPAKIWEIVNGRWKQTEGTLVA